MDINFTLSRRYINIPLRHHLDAAAASYPLIFFCVGPSFSSFLLPLPLRDLALLFPLLRRVFAAPARSDLRAASTAGLSCLTLRGEFSLRCTRSTVHDPLCAVSSVSACDTGAPSSSSSGRAPDSVRPEIFDVNRSASQLSEGEELIAVVSDKGFPASWLDETEGSALAVAKGVWMCSGRFCARFEPLGF